ncbi:unnamed protein product, partial [Chrysoparadoxa australica]
MPQVEQTWALYGHTTKDHMTKSESVSPKRPSSILKGLRRTPDPGKRKDKAKRKTKSKKGASCSPKALGKLADLEIGLDSHKRTESMEEFLEYAAVKAKQQGMGAPE